LLIQMKFIVELVILLFLFPSFSSCYDNFQKDLERFYKGYSGYKEAMLQNNWVPYPNTTDIIFEDWYLYVSTIAKLLGNVKSYSINDENEFSTFKNDVNSFDELTNMAKELSLVYKSLLADTIRGFPITTYTSFGPDNLYMIKSDCSIKSKLIRKGSTPDGEDLSAENCTVSQEEKNQLSVTYLKQLRDIGDVLRGSIVVTKVQQISQVLARLAIECKRKNYKLFIDNKYHKFENRENFNFEYYSGYVAVHCSVHLSNKQGKYMKAEIQVHFFDVFDGTEECPKEKSHHIYELTRSSPDSNLKTLGNKAQFSQFTFGFKRVITFTN